MVFYISLIIIVLFVLWGIISPSHLSETAGIAKVVEQDVTSADSATFVLGMLPSKGDLNPKNKVKIVWGLLQSSIAIILLISGGLEGLETMAIITALPFAVILVMMCFSFMKALKDEPIKSHR